MTPTRHPPQSRGSSPATAAARGQSYATDLKLFRPWCEEARLDLFDVRRAHLEFSGRWMEETERSGGDCALMRFVMPRLRARRLTVAVVGVSVHPPCPGNGSARAILGVWQSS